MLFHGKFLDLLIEVAFFILMIGSCDEVDSFVMNPGWDMVVGMFSEAPVPCLPVGSFDQ